MNGKGKAPEKGRNLTLYRKNYEAIFSNRSPVLRRRPRVSVRSDSGDLLVRPEGHRTGSDEVK